MAGEHSASLSVAGVPGVTGDLEITDFNINGITLDDIDMTHQGTSNNGETAARAFEPSVFYDPGTITLTCQWTTEELPSIGETSEVDAFEVVLSRSGGDLPIIRGTAYLKSISNYGGTLGQKITADLEFKFTGEINFDVAPVT